jgi:hypothetical protein
MMRRLLVLLVLPVLPQKVLVVLVPQAQKLNERKA